VHRGFPSHTNLNPKTKWVWKNSENRSWWFKMEFGVWFDYFTWCEGEKQRERRGRERI